MVKKLEGAGLRGQVAGETSLSTVGQIEGLQSDQLLIMKFLLPPDLLDQHLLTF